MGTIQTMLAVDILLKMQGQTQVFLDFDNQMLLYIRENLVNGEPYYFSWINYHNKMLNVPAPQFKWTLFIDSKTYLLLIKTPFFYDYHFHDIYINFPRETIKYNFNYDMQGLKNLKCVYKWSLIKTWGEEKGTVLSINETLCDLHFIKNSTPFFPGITLTDLNYVNVYEPSESYLDPFDATYMEQKPFSEWRVNEYYGDNRNRSYHWINWKSWSLRDFDWHWKSRRYYNWAWKQSLSLFRESMTGAPICHFKNQLIYMDMSYINNSHITH